MLLPMATSFRNTPTMALLRALHRSYRAVTSHIEEGVSLRGLQPSEFDVIATLGNTEGLKMCELASRTLSSPANITRLVKKLEARGLVRRERSPYSDREVLARLTAEGEALFEVAYPEQYEFHRAWFDTSLSPEDQATLTRLLERLAHGAPSVHDKEHDA